MVTLTLSIAKGKRNPSMYFGYSLMGQHFE